MKAIKKISYKNEPKNGFKFYILPAPRGISFYPTHGHDYYEFTYVFNGRGYHITEEKKEYFSSSALFFMPPGEGHSFISKDKEIIFQVSFVIYPELFRECQTVFNVIDFLDNLTKRKIRTIDMSLYTEVLKNSIVEIQEEYYLEPVNFQEVVISNLLKIFVFVDRVVNKQNMMFSKFENLPFLITEALKIFEKEFYSINKIKDITSQLRIDEKYFIRLFKKHIFLTPIQYLNRLKIEKVANFIRYGDLKISQAASEVGFNDLGYFNKLFKRFLSLTPSEFKILVKNKQFDFSKIDRFKF